jgi:hypothetical protein
MLGAAVAETARKDPGRGALLFALWTEREQQRQGPLAVIPPTTSPNADTAGIRSLELNPVAV